MMEMKTTTKKKRRRGRQIGDAEEGCGMGGGESEVEGRGSCESGQGRKPDKRSQWRKGLLQLQVEGADLCPSRVSPLFFF